MKANGILTYSLYCPYHNLQQKTLYSIHHKTKFSRAANHSQGLISEYQTL